jgi:superfamily II DNA or RNA helicase
MSLRLRDYQQRAKDLYVKSLVTHHTAPLLVAPTGAGKTVIAVSIMEDLLSQGFQVFFLAPRKELIDQTSRKLDEAGMNDHGVIMAGHWRVRPRARCQVCSQQTLINRLHHIGKADRIAVFCDEAHHAVSPTIKKIKEHAEAQADIFLFIGMTATPYRADGKGLGEVFDDLIEVASLHELTQREYLVPAVEFVGEHIDLTGIGIVAGDLNQKKAATRYADKRIIGSAVRQYEEHAAGRKFVLFATDIENSKMYAKMFTDSGIPCAHLDGTMAKGVRQGILSRHQSGELVGVSNYGVLTEGYDDPATDCIVCLRPTKFRPLDFRIMQWYFRPHTFLDLIQHQQAEVDEQLVPTYRRIDRYPNQWNRLIQLFQQKLD